MKRKRVELKSESELLTWPTKRLLARLRQLHRCEASQALSDQPETDRTLHGGIRFKEAEDWQAAYQQVKLILASREHVSRVRHR